MNKYLRQWIDETYPLMGDDIEELDHYDLQKFADWMEEQFAICSVVSSFLDNLKDSDSQALLEMRERNQEEFIKWCAENPNAGVDDEWENDIMFMRDVAKYIEDLVV